MKKSLKIVFSIALILASLNAESKETIYFTKHVNPPATRAGCSPTTQSEDLDINNVRARIMNGGDMWWDRGKSVAAYEVPKGSGKNKKNALFAGSLWVGGKDAASGNVLKVAAQTYRQAGNDYWSGPLDDNASIEANSCALWDKMWKIDQADIVSFRSIYFGLTDTAEIQNAISLNISKVKAIIKEWPAKGNKSAKGSGGFNLNLPANKDYAPFEDVNDDGVYNYEDGDYPVIKGDQYIWWVFNDKGNVQTNTGGLSIGIEIQASAFAFNTNNSINDATFYNYKLINKSSSDFIETYTATWSDADLGYANDDYVGCDVERGLGILYNADDYDNGEGGYGYDIPMIGIDFFRGPKVPVPSLTNPDSMAPLKMKYFTFFNNITGPYGDPDNDVQYYNYMTGKWGDGTPFVLSCNGLGTGTPSNYAFPDEYRECNPCANPAGDRRFVHSAGPFTMEKGVANDITIGAVFVPSVGGGCPSFGKLRIADDRAQQLFKDEFKLSFGPMAPDVVVKPFDGRFVFYVNNPRSSNNFNEQYGNDDSSSKYKEKAADGTSDSLYKFEGYLVYQLKSPTVSISQLRKKDGTVDETKARLVYQCDKKNNISNVFNYEKDPEISVDFYSPKLMVTGKNEGIVRNFSLTTDAFASGVQNRLVNYKTYYYIMVAYSYNQFQKFEPGKGGQEIEYLESRTDGRQLPIKVLKVTPHPAYDNLYTETKATYGDGVEIKRIQGIGNGGNDLELTDASAADILANSAMANPVYKSSRGPIQVKITDADSLKPGEYTIYLNSTKAGASIKDSVFGAFGPTTTWSIVRDNNGITDTIYSEKPIREYNQQILAQWGADKNATNPTADWGIAIGIQQKARPGDVAVVATGLINKSIEKDLNVGYITSSLTFENVADAWLSGIQDAEGNNPTNWIRSGEYTTPAGTPTWNNVAMEDYSPTIDNNGVYEKIINGTWAPYFMANKENGPTSGMGIMYYKGSADRAAANIINNQSVDIVFTADRSKWTRCSVIEMGESILNTTANGNTLTEKGAWKYNLRNHASLERDPDANGNPVYSTSDSGHSWFPGYAINLETGERLNITFGEDSGDPANNGTDMIYNPTNVDFDPVNFKLKWGGHHVVYISRTRYDAQPGGGDFIYNTLKSLNGFDPGFNTTEQKNKRSVYASMMWVSPTMNIGRKLKSWKEGIVPTTATVKIRVNRPYGYYDNGSAINNNYPVYQFNTKDILPSKLTEGGNKYLNDEDGLLARLNVVPNPYYAYSEYETSRLDNRIKIINLPAVATIKIYSTDGALIKTINKSDAGTTYVEWDVNNEKGVPIASGLYLIHVKIKTDQGEKERVLKWFGIMRPTDLTSF
jgi:hypothetical protein